MLACGGDDDGSGDGDGDVSAIDGGGGGGDDGGGGGDIDGSGGDTADAAGGDFEGIPCADDTCTAGDEVCCAGEGGLTCEAECTTISFACDGPEDCPGADDICCGTGEEGTQCLAPGDCGGQADGEVICHAAGDCPEAGDECCMRPEANVGICRAHCPGPN